MSLRSLSDSVLLEKTRELARREQALTVEVIAHLGEVNRRRLFAAQGYGSLFEYSVRALGYSEPAASQRVAAMRLAHDVPEAREALASGALPLTAAASVQRFVRREEKCSGVKVSQDRKRELVAKCVGLPSREVERVLVAEASRPEAARPERARALAGGASELRFVADERLLALIERAREVHGDLPLGELFARALETHLERTDPLRKAARAAEREKTRALRQSALQANRQRTASQAPELDRKPDWVVEPGGSRANEPGGSRAAGRSRYIPAPARHAVQARARGQCEWRDPATGAQCASRHRLEYDHVEPFALGGTHAPENLRMACPQHQRLAAIEVFGAARMTPYLRS